MAKCIYYNDVNYKNSKALHELDIVSLNKLFDLRYTMFNKDTGTLFYCTDNLQAIKNFFYNVPKRKRTTLMIVDNNTGEIIKSK